MILSLLLAAASTLVVPATGPGVFDRELHQVAEGVYVAVRPDVLRQPVEPNLGFVVNEKDVVVIDFPTAAYDHADPDKYRLPIDTPLIPYSFAGARGW